ncbi:MAG TPA: hypothetical protein GX734_01850 [Clostridiaceae bacterium]|jgi:hypothetical protein|nr:hypothetical protein [Clostridiaceae bacterium]
MVMYFILGLLASLALVCALFVLLFIFLRIIWNHACRSRLTFLAPLLLVTVISYLSITILVPMVFDCVQLINRQYSVREIEIPDEVTPRNHTLTLDGQKFYFPPGVFKSNEHGRYQITYTPRTHYIINVMRFGDVPDHR